MDNETKGIGNSYDFGARIYDSRLGRWLSVDPLTRKNPGITPFHFTYNSPLIFVDPDGEDGKLVIDSEKNTITLETTMHIYGAKENINRKQLIEDYNKKFAAMDNEKKVLDKDGKVVWTVKFDFKFVYSESLDNMNRTIQEEDVPEGENAYNLSEKLTGREKGHTSRWGKIRRWFVRF